MNAFIQQGCKMYQNVTVETFIILQKVSISDKNCSSKNVKEFWKKVSVFTKIWSSKKRFLSIKSASFLKDHVTLDTGVMMLKIQFCITGMN